MKPEEIEAESFAIITRELGDTALPEEIAPVVKRVIHTTADFDYAHTLTFSHNAIASGLDALRAGCPIVTDTRMAQAGINAAALRRFGVETHCHIADADVAETARQKSVTRSKIAMDKAVRLYGDAIYVIGNAPTALLRLCECIDAGMVRPKLVVGVPVGFVNVVESKDQMFARPVPSIIARGRKGGSNVAAAICNALLYMLTRMNEEETDHAQPGD